MSNHLQLMFPTRKWWILLTFLLASCASHPPIQKRATQYQWVEMGPDSHSIVRAITTDTVCPSVQFGGTFQAMTPRGLPTEKFPARVCELEIPNSVQSAQIDDQPLPLLSAKPKRILILGDTGCRIKGEGSQNWVQDCRDPNSWPFQKLAQLASEWHPDLVIHVGDYLYREVACPVGNSGCTGSPWGDRWDTWKADFFTPATPLLSSAPWIFVRGNHESCKRSGEGWFRFLDPRPYTETCVDDSEPYTLQINGTRMIVFDSSHAPNSASSQAQIDQYAAQLKSASQSSDQNTWLLTHQPVWGASQVYESHPPRQITLNATLQKAVEQSGIRIDLVFSGHIHLFEALRFQDTGPSQFILGNGGTELTSLPLKMNSIEIGKRKVKEGVAIREFGYLTLEESSQDQWDAEAFNLDGKVIQKCRIQGSKAHCGL